MVIFKLTNWPSWWLKASWQARPSGQHLPRDKAWVPTPDSKPFSHWCQPSSGSSSPPVPACHDSLLTTSSANQMLSDLQALDLERPSARKACAPSSTLGKSSVPQGLPWMAPPMLLVGTFQSSAQLNTLRPSLPTGSLSATQFPIPELMVEAQRRQGGRTHDQQGWGDSAAAKSQKC